MADFFAAVLVKIGTNLVESLIIRLAEALFPSAGRPQDAPLAA